jgi:hypothetical protein
MENSAHADPSDSVPAYPTSSEGIQLTDTHTGARKPLDLHHATSSSPDLIKPSLPALGMANATLSRTRTLPLKSPKRSPSIFPTLQGITFEIENLERLRRWVLGLAIGNCPLLILPYTLCVYPLHFSRFRPRARPLTELHISTVAVVPVRSREHVRFLLPPCVGVGVEEIWLERPAHFRHFLIRRYSKKDQKHIPFEFENRSRERTKEVPLYLIAGVRRPQTASFMVFLILIKKRAPLPSAATLRYCHPIARRRLLTSVVPEVHRGVDTASLSSTVLCVTEQDRTPLSHSR